MVVDAAVVVESMDEKSVEAVESMAATLEVMDEMRRSAKLAFFLRFMRQRGMYFAPYR